jgi:hypothetical protein
LKGGEKVKNRILLILLAVTLILSAGLVGCGSEQIAEYTLTVSSTEGGSVTSPGEPGPYAYDEGEVVNLVAKADEGYQFDSWTGDVDEIADVEDSTTLITMKDDYSITATFAVKQYSLVIHSTEGGSVTTPGENAYTHDKGEVVDLVAVAEEGYVFTNWTGDVSTIVDVDAASTTIIMNGGYSIAANFAGAIRDWYDLDAIRDNLDGSYILMNDLDSTTAGYMELSGRTANGGEGWEPIGGLSVDPVSFWIVDLTNAFTGNLDGRRCEITDLFIDRPDEDGVGLFGSASEAVIENLGMVNTEVTGRSYVGGLVGGSRAIVTNSYSAGSVSGDQQVGGLAGGIFWDSTVSSSYSAGSVTGEGQHTGGLVGGTWGTVSESYSRSTVTGGHMWVGGLSGGNWGTVTNSYFTGSVSGDNHVGGLSGGNWGTVTNSYSSSEVTGAGPVGGLVGFNHLGTVSNCYCRGSMTGDFQVGGLVGENHDATVSNSYYNCDEVLINGRNIITIGALPNEEFEQWLANDKSLDVNETLSQEDGYYLIYNVSDFKSLLAFGQNGALKFRLTDDLDLGGEPSFYIPYLAGEFDGNNHKIANLSFSFDFITQVGLFGYLASGGAITGVGAENVNITGQGIVGGLVGENDGTMSNSYSTGRVAGYWCIGGLVGSTGWHGGTVNNSHYNYDEVLINGKNVITIGALFDEDFDQWLANDKFLDVSERLSQEDGYYVLNDVSDFKQLLAFGQDSSSKFGLKNDLDLSSEPNFYIPYLAGEFDGNGHRITNLRLSIDVVAQVGLFGYLASSGKLSQVGVENVNVTVTNSRQAGGLVGGTSGTVSNSYSSGSVTGDNFVGGLVGWIGWNGATVSNSYSSSSVTGNWGVGGLVGWNYGGTVSNSYSIGKVTGDEYVGGLAGQNHDGTVTNSFWDTQTSGMATSVGGTGKTTAQMKNIATFSDAGWSIITVANPDTRNLSYIWNIVDEQTYPFLSWEL